MTFKDAAYKDISNVFMNETEFGEWHTINGKKMLIVVDANEVEERGKSSLNTHESTAYMKITF